MKNSIFVCIITILSSCSNQPSESKTKIDITKNNYFDKNESIFKKLYRENNVKVDYWETWNESETIATIHWGTTKDLERRERIRNILNEHLGWTGNGSCGDADIGSGEMTLFADVIKPEIAIKTIKNELKQNKITDEVFARITKNREIIKEQF